MKSSVKAPSSSRNKIRVNIVLEANIYEDLKKDIPFGERSEHVESWIKKGLRDLERLRALEKIKKLRQKSVTIPFDDAASTTDILRDFRYQL